MEEIKGFVTCAHCSGSGTCKNGENESSCYACKKEIKYKKTEPTSGLVCSVCRGVGVAEPKSVRIHNRIVPLLAILIVYFTLAIVMLKSSNENFSEILAFAGTLIGSVTGYYFGGKTKL